MFTGIIQWLGVFQGYRQGRREMAVAAPASFPDLGAGESIAVNGVCLSLTRRDGNILFFDLSRETLGKTNLGSLQSGAKLNLEPPLSLQSLLSGHLVTGHIDGRGRVLRVAERRPGRRLVISFPRELRSYFIPKGSVAINGVSLTIAKLGPASFDVELVPLTVEKSNLKDLRRGQEVNLECDILGKYVYNWLNKGNKQD
jgi:riboflavin synthase